MNYPDHDEACDPTDGSGGEAGSLHLLEPAGCEIPGLMETPTDVAAAVILRDDRVLVARRAPGQKMAGLWEFPGGKLEPGETVQACIVRELLEELAITGHAGQVLATNLHRYPGGAINLIAVQFDMTGDSWQLSVHDQVDWVGLDALLDLELAPADIPIAEHLCGAFGRAEGYSE